MSDMDIQIIGLGVVGSAHAYLSAKLGHRVYGYDISPKAVEKAIQKVPSLIKIPDYKRDVDITFICTPESEVEGVVKKLVEKKVKGLYVIRSTLPIGTTTTLINRYGTHITYNPEFLREKHAFYDVMNPSRIVIGACCYDHSELLHDFYKPLKTEFYFTDPTTAETIKLVSNCLRSIMISFWNELYLLSRAIPFDLKMVSEATDPGKVIGEWEGGKWGTRFFGKPYGGKCLPKDTKMMIEIFKEHRVPEFILEAAEKVNELIKKGEG